MEYVSLGRTGVQVSRLCLGCMMFGWRTSEEESFVIIDRAIDGGINFLDTANIYGRGGSEEVVGKALRRNGKRGNIVLASKFHHRMDDHDLNSWGNSRRHIIQQCDASLRRLQTDYIDLYQIHRPQSSVPMDETLRALDDLIRAGKVRYAGSSTFAAWQVMESFWISKELGLNRLVSEQPPYNMLDRRIERELIPMAQTYGLALLPWSPLAAGFLTGKYEEHQPRPTDARLHEENSWYNRHFKQRAFQVVEEVKTLAGKKGCTPAQLALAWCLHRPGITSPIIGPRTLDQLEDNLKALQVVLQEEDAKEVDRFAPPGGVTIEYYEADFGPHQYRW